MDVCVSRAIGRRPLRRLAVGAALLCLPLTSAPADAQLMLQGAQPHLLKPAPTRPTGPPAAGSSAAKPAAPRAGSSASPAAGGEPKPATAFYLNGGESTLRLDRSGDVLSAELTLAGHAIDDPAQVCHVSMGSGAKVSAQGRPEGLPRYRVDASACPLDLDVMGDAAFVTGPEGGTCTFVQAGCQADVTGLWGPKGTALGPRVKEIERERGRADVALRDVFRQLMSRTPSQDMSRVAAEQAGFSSKRTTDCASYVAEDAHGFCNTRTTQARVIALRSRLPPAPAAAEARAQAPATRPAQP